MNMFAASALLLIALLAPDARASAQLDLPALPKPVAQQLAAVSNAFSGDTGSAAATADDDDDDDDSHAGGPRASAYDRDRSERFGPPYSLDNIERAPPSSFAAGPPDRQPHHDEYTPRGLGETPRVLNNNNNYPPEYPRVPAQYPDNGDNYRLFGAARTPANGDSDRFYQRPAGGGANDWSAVGGRDRPYWDDDKYYNLNGGSYGYDNRDYGNNGGGGYGFPRGRDRDREYGPVDYDRNRPNDERRYNAGRQPGFEDDRNRYDQDRHSQLETAKLKKLLEKIDRQSSAECALNVRAQWDFETNVNEITQINAVSAVTDH